MKRLLAVLLLISVITLGAFAQTTYLQPTSIPVNPILAGQGGSFTANASGYNSLFKNPAGFAMDGGDFTLLSANVWSFADQSLIDFAMDPNGIEAYYTNMGTQLAEQVTPETIETWAATTTEAEVVQMLDTAGYDTTGLSLSDAASIQQFLDDEGISTLAETIATSADPAAAIAAADPEVINLATAVVEDITGGQVELLPSGNLRVGANIGLLGGVGGGFGFGININTDAYLKGQTIVSAEGYAEITATVTAGYALAVIPEFLYIGADVRPLYRVYMPVSGSQALDLAANFSDVMSVLNSYTTYAGWGIGIDAGAIITLGDLHIGATVTDILGTALNYQTVPAGDLLQQISAFQIPSGTAVSDIYMIPMDVLVGVSYTLNFSEDSYLGIHAEVSNALRGPRGSSGR